MELKDSGDIEIVVERASEKPCAENFNFDPPVDSMIKFENVPMPCEDVFVNVPAMVPLGDKETVIKKSWMSDKTLSVES